LLKTLHCYFARSNFHRAEICVCMIRKGRHTRRNYQVLRADASPQGVNCICDYGEAHTALRGWRPISAALSIPIPSFNVPGLKDFPFTTRPNGLNTTG